MAKVFFEDVLYKKKDPGNLLFIVEKFKAKLEAGGIYCEEIDSGFVVAGSGICIGWCSGSSCVGLLYTASDEDISAGYGRGNSAGRHRLHRPASDAAAECVRGRQQ
ncbi:MAG: hypothetical protein LBR61_06060 [Synergistaceae bacterium]|nr:hypothetical protein [Synergistaceae bacterium]